MTQGSGKASDSTNKAQQPDMMKSWMDTCSRNMDALAQASRMSAEVFQGITRLQGEHMKQMMRDLGQMAHDMAQPGDIKDKMMAHAGKVKAGVESATSHAKELSKAVQENARNVSGLIHKRIQDAMHENRKHFDHMHQQGKTPHEMMKHWTKTLHGSASSHH